LLSGSDGARDLDQRAEHSQTSGAEQAEFLSGRLTDDRREFPGAELIARNAQKARGGGIKSRTRREGGRVVHGREVHAPVSISANAPLKIVVARIEVFSRRWWKSRRRSRLRFSPGGNLVKSIEKSDGMNRGTPALIAASSRTVCVPPITSRNPCSADTTHDAPKHAGATSEAPLQSTWAIVTPSSRSCSTLAGAALDRTSALTLAPRSSKALAMRRPRLPVAPATTMVGPFIVPLTGCSARLRQSQLAPVPPRTSLTVPPISSSSRPALS